jgi:hypothetical protein
VGIASIAVGIVVTDVALLCLISLFGGRIEDNWVGMLGVVGFVVGFAGSAVAFLLAIASRIKHDHGAGLRLPTALFPVFCVIVLLGVVFLEG